MAVVGGVQGSQVLSFRDIADYAMEALDLQSNVVDEPSVPNLQAGEALQPFTTNAPLMYDY